MDAEYDFSLLLAPSVLSNHGKNVRMLTVGRGSGSPYPVVQGGHARVSDLIYAMTVALSSPLSADGARSDLHY